MSTMRLSNLSTQVKMHLLQPKTTPASCFLYITNFYIIMINNPIACNISINKPFRLKLKSGPRIKKQVHI